jgi:endonuclease YncB( thermonuclease family)
LELRYLTGLLLVMILATLLTPHINTQLTSASGIGVHSDFPHARVVVTYVVDGDTVRISPPVYVAGQYRTVVRLADITAPDVSTPEGNNSRSALVGLLSSHGCVVYLDIDKSRGVDEYGRVIAVLYVRINATTLLNVNKWLVDNGYASVKDYTDNDFDPSKWVLYLEYPLEYEKLPSKARVFIASTPQGVNYGSSYGFKLAVTPDGNYIGLAFSEYGTYHLWVVVLDKNGNVVRRVNLSDVALQYGLVNVTNVFRGMLSIAANNSGFLVAWNQYSALVGTTLRSRITMYTYIPIDTSVPIPYNTSINQFFYLFNGSYQYHPHAAWYCDASGNCYWIIGYHYISSTANGRLFFYALQPDLVTKIPAGGFRIDLTPRVASADPTGIGVGIDALSGVLYDPVTKSFVWVARNYTNTTGYDLEVVKGGVDLGNNTLVIERTPINNSIGDVGPTPEFYGTTTIYTYNNVYPMHTVLLRSGGYLLTVYNASTTALAYSVVDLKTGSANGVVLLDYGMNTTFYPWVTSGVDKWLLAYSARGYINFTLVDTSGGNNGLFTLSDRSSAYVRTVYDAVNKYYLLSYSVRDENTGNYNLYLALYRQQGNSIGNYIIPLNTDPSISKIPVGMQVVPGLGVIVFAIEGNNVIAYIVSSNYPESQTPQPIPAPTTTTPTETTTTPTTTTTTTPPPTPTTTETTTPAPTETTTTTTTTPTETTTTPPSMTTITTTETTTVYRTIELTTTKTETTTIVETTVSRETETYTYTYTSIRSETITLTSQIITATPDIVSMSATGLIGLIVGVIVSYLLLKKPLKKQ